MIVKGCVIFERTLLSRKKSHNLAWSCAISNIFYCGIEARIFTLFLSKVWVLRTRATAISDSCSNQKKNNWKWIRNAKCIKWTWIYCQAFLMAFIVCIADIFLQKCFKASFDVKILMLGLFMYYLSIQWRSMNTGSFRLPFKSLICFVHRLWPGRVCSNFITHLCHSLI